MAEQRIAAITGAGGALGGAVATHLVANGWRVALYDMERAEKRIASLIDSLGGSKVAAGFTGDFATSETWNAALDATTRAFGSLPSAAALIAGGWEGGAALHASEDDAIYHRLMRANVETAYRAMRSLLPSMVANKSGSVVVVGSRAALRPETSTNAAVYAASKAAVVAMAEAVAAEVRDHRVRVNAILPSTLDTPANRKAMPSAAFDRWVALDSAAGVVGFLLSDAARDISGAAIPVYGRA
jgi:NAD(P)-dependent dehydrogenase (short-subunit alcohol dehydrogenase family)